jgi:hypothetical protein
MTLKGHDYWAAPLVLTSSKTLVINETGVGDVTLTVPAGTYYVHDPRQVFPGVTNLLKTLEDLADASSLFDEYSFEHGSPSASYQQEGKGFNLSNAAGSPFYIKEGSSTLDLSWLGFSGTGDLTPVAGNLAGDRMCYGRWFPPTRAAFKDRHTLQMVEYNSEDTTHPDFEVVDKGSRTLRWFDYNAMPAAHVLTGKANRSTYASVAKLAEGDVWNAFETVWEFMRQGLSVLVVHDYDTLENPEFELVKLYDPKLARSLRDCLSLEYSGGELYSVAFMVQVVSGDFAE